MFLEANTYGQEKKCFGKIPRSNMEHRAQIQKNFRYNFLKIHKSTGTKKFLLNIQSFHFFRFICFYVCLCICVWTFCFEIHKRNMIFVQKKRKQMGGVGKIRPNFLSMCIFSFSSQCVYFRFFHIYAVKLLFPF